MASITLKNIVKTYDNKVTVIPGLDLEIHDKEFIILVGPSGCGKSTTLRMIAGLEEITAGELYIGEKKVNNVAPKDRDIAMVFQNYALYPHMTVYKNMAFGLMLRKTPRAEIDRKVHEAAQTLGIEEYLNRKPRALSGGQRQRVALGRAMVRNPSVFLLDEPLSNLDAKLRTQMRTEIIRLHKQLETTFVYVTHDQTEAMTMADRIVVMKDGIIQQVDTPQALYHSPENLFVAGFIGSPQMNFINADVILDGEAVFLHFGECRIRVPLSPILTRATPGIWGQTNHSRPAPRGFAHRRFFFRPCRRRCKIHRACGAGRNDGIRNISSPGGRRPKAHRTHTLARANSVRRRSPARN